MLKNHYNGLIKYSFKNLYVHDLHPRLSVCVTCIWFDHGLYVHDLHPRLSVCVTCIWFDHGLYVHDLHPRLSVCVTCIWFDHGLYVHDLHPRLFLQVKHFSKYGLVDDSDDEDAMETDLQKLLLLRQQKQQQLALQVRQMTFIDSELRQIHAISPYNNRLATLRKKGKSLANIFDEKVREIHA